MHLNSFAGIIGDLVVVTGDLVVVGARVVPSSHPPVQQSGQRAIIRFATSATVNGVTTEARPTNLPLIIPFESNTTTPG